MDHVLYVTLPPMTSETPGNQLSRNMLNKGMSGQMNYETEKKNEKI